MADIASLRARIDAIDEVLVPLLNERAAQALAIGRLKAETGLAVAQPGRQAEVIRHISTINRGPLDEEGLLAIFLCIIREFSRLEHVVGHEHAAGMKEPPFRRIGIVGLGLIGGSIALCVRKTWPEVEMIGLERPDQLADLRRHGVVDSIADDLAGLAACDLIVLAVPVPVVLELMSDLSRLSTQASGGPVITDVGSTKREVMAAAAAARLPRFIGGHPMAGSEHSGLDHAAAGLFAGRAWLLVHGDGGGGGGRGAAADLERFVAGLGAVPRWMVAEPHDHAMAYVSHLPQLVAIALMNAATGAVGADGLAAAGPAFGEMTRTASSPPDMWQGILASNADFVADAVARFVASLPPSGGVARAEWVRDAFARAGAARDRWRSGRSS